MRRRDFLIGRAHSVPTIEGAAQQLIKILKKLELKVIFVATDAEDHGTLDFFQRFLFLFSLLFNARSSTQVWALCSKTRALCEADVA